MTQEIVHPLLGYFVPIHGLLDGIPGWDRLLIFIGLFTGYMVFVLIRIFTRKRRQDRLWEEYSKKDDKDDA